MIRFLLVLFSCLISNLAVASLAFDGHPAQKFETISLPGVTVADSQTQTISLGGYRYIRSLVIQAEGVRIDSTLEVMVNGVAKGTIYAPGRDPSYIVTIAEIAESIQFRHRAGGVMRIVSIQATVSPYLDPIFGGGGFHGTNSGARELAHRALMAIESLKPWVTPVDEKTYLLPIKIQAGQVLVHIDAHGSVSQKAIQAMKALVQEIDFAHTYITDLMKDDGTFKEAVELVTVRESIQDLLD